MMVARDLSEKMTSELKPEDTAKTRWGGGEGGL